MVWDRYLRRGLERIDLDRPDPAKLAALPNPFWRDNYAHSDPVIRTSKDSGRIFRRSPGCAG
jgi:hypothetical protein